jgi:hypothetical protein
MLTRKNYRCQFASIKEPRTESTRSAASAVSGLGKFAIQPLTTPSARAPGAVLRLFTFFVRRLNGGMNQNSNDPKQAASKAIRWCLLAIGFLIAVGWLGLLAFLWAEQTWGSDSL